MVFNVICSDNFVVKMKDLMRFKPLEQIHNAEKKAPQLPPLSYDYERFMQWGRGT